MENTYIKGKILCNTLDKVDYYVSTVELCVLFKGNTYSIELFRIETIEKPINYLLIRVAQEVWNNKKYRSNIITGQYADVELYAIEKLYEFAKRCKLPLRKSGSSIDRYALNINMNEEFDICAFSVMDIIPNNPTVKMNKLINKDLVEIPESKVLIQIYKASNEIKIDIISTGGIILHSLRINCTEKDLNMYSYASILRGIRMTTKQFRDGTWLYAPGLSESMLLSYAKIHTNLIDLINETELRNGA